MQMQHAPVTIEEQLLVKAIKEECTWENLPKRVQATLSSKEEWNKKIIDHCTRKRLPWNTCLARKVCKENEYYEEMMRYLRKSLALFPYHLADYVCRVMRMSAFRYYRDMIFETMKNEQPYDSIPNFSAADALRLTGIGRNEFIDIMNKCKSKKFMWKLNKSIAKELLPTQPVDFPIEAWWDVCLVNFTLEEFKKLSEEETATIDKVCKEEVTSYILFDSEILKGLYRRGLIYFDVPVFSDDRFKVTKLEGFVSNRDQTYEDPIEEQLYALFVVSSENATVAELATTLQADLSQLQAAASFACRLGWAVKEIDPVSILQGSGLSPRASLSDEDASRASLASENMFTDGDSALQESTVARVAFIVDANITSYLMMGSISPGLKSHAVTLYEAGKLGHTSIADLCNDLSALEGAKFEGELQELTNHAVSLRRILECLRSGGVTTGADTKAEEISNKLGKVSSTTVESTPLDNEVVSSDSIEADVKNNDSDTSEFVSENMSSGEPNASGDKKHSAAGDDGSDSPEEVCKSDTEIHNDEKIKEGEGSGVGKEAPKRKKKYRVDILRSESLASLAPVTLDRLFLRNYDIVVSMVPLLPHASVLPGPSGPFHFGPPSYSSMTPWMKLVLYSTLANGPVSVVLMKGQSLRLLPAPLAGCEKALMWSWDGSSLGGLGGKFDGYLVKGSLFLHFLNSLLKQSAVLVLPLSRYDLDESGKTITMDIPLPLKNSDGTVSCVGQESGLSEKERSKVNSVLTYLATKLEMWPVGYIRLLRLHRERDSDMFSPDDEKYEWVPLGVEFGIPLFSPKLCSDICKRIVTSEMLQTDSLGKHHSSMQSLRKKLRDMCAEYHATGPAAKLLYQKDQPNGSSSRQLMKYASGRWNPLVDSSSPIAGALSDNQRLKLAIRHRCRTEILSFDGSILRSYALSPVNEVATRSTEEASQTNPGKESDENDSKEVVLPGVNLLFDGSGLHPFDIGACLQARQPITLIADAAAASVSHSIK